MSDEQKNTDEEPRVILPLRVDYSATVKRQVELIREGIVAYESQMVAASVRKRQRLDARTQTEFGPAPVYCNTPEKVRDWIEKKRKPKPRSKKVVKISDYAINYRYGRSDNDWEPGETPDTLKQVQTRYWDARKRFKLETESMFVTGEIGHKERARRMDMLSRTPAARGRLILIMSREYRNYQKQLVREEAEREAEELKRQHAADKAATAKYKRRETITEPLRRKRIAKAVNKAVAKKKSKRQKKSIALCKKSRKLRRGKR